MSFFSLSRGLLSVPLILTLAPSVVRAALVIENRLTRLEANTQFGFIGGVTTQFDSKTYGSLTTDLQVTLGGSNSGEGALGDGSWIANFNYQHFQNLVVQPNGWEASGSTDVFAFTGDQGIAVVEAQSGNQLELGFHVNETTTYTFSGALTDWADAQLEQSLGNGLWNPVAQPSTGVFESQLILTPGNYRLVAVGGGYHDGSMGSGSAWVARLTAVPEPSTWALGFAGFVAVASAGGLARKCRPTA